MAHVLIISDEQHKWNLIRDIVFSHDINNRIIPEYFKPIKQADEFIGILTDVAIVDLCLSTENQYHLNGISVLESLYKNNPDCYLILMLWEIKVSDVPFIPIPIRGKISASSFNQSCSMQLKEHLDRFRNFKRIAS